ncbi:MAG: IS1595 family transposase [Caldilineaceae bacterium]|nr:IS1595 family transposase [Caldilineaceae bacterium]
MTLIELFNKFPDERSAREWFENIRWPDDERRCPCCGGKNTYHVKSEKPMPYRCSDCRKYFNVRTGMVMQGSKVPLRKWVIAIYLLTSTSKGMSSIALHKALGVTQKTAWYMNQRIREGWNLGAEPMTGPAEVDEVYIGGKEKNKHGKKKLHAGRGFVGKIPVLGVKQRGGVVFATPAPNTTKPVLTDFVRTTVKKGETVYTDENSGYNDLHFRYKHEVVNHGAREYVREQVHTNSIESFWALLRRGYYGVYHYMSPKHLHRYVNEFSGRQNARGVDPEVQMAMLVKGMERRRLPYQELIAD